MARLLGTPYCVRMPPMLAGVAARACVRSGSTTSTRPVNPSARRWYATLAPTIAPPPITTSAVLILDTPSRSAAYLKQIVDAYQAEVWGEAIFATYCLAEWRF